MGCGCNGKSKSNVKESKRLTKPKSGVIKLTETDLKNLINKVIKTSK